MKLQRFLFIAIFLCAFLSLAATLISYNFHYPDPRRILDGQRGYRGWPLYWIVAETSLWGEPPYSSTYRFQPVNFLVDIVFWAVVFQLPSVTLLLLKEGRKARTEVKISQK